MKKLFYTLLVVCSLSACGDTDYAELADCQLDFGQGEYEEPFVGVLKQKPEILRKSLHFPPYSWLAPDTLVLKKELAIDFNEESIRSKSTATISLVDSSYNPIQNLQLYINNNPVSKGSFTVKADSLSKSLVISCKVHPDLGDKEAKGYIMVQGNELDLVNSKSIQQDINSIGTWNLKQTYNIPWLLWLLWLLTAAIVIALCVIGVWCIVKSFIILVKFITAMRIPPLKFSNKCSYKRYHAKKQCKSEEQKEENNDEDYHTRMPRNGNKGMWTGKRGNSTFVFFKNSKPKSANYGNENDLTFEEMGQLLGDSNPGVTYKHGFPDFDRDPDTPNGKPYEVSFSTGIEKYLNPNNLDNRQKLHEEAFNKLKDKLGISYDEIDVFKGNSAAAEKLAKEWNCSVNEVWKRCNNPHHIQRVWHEETDCKTLRLVPRMYHDNVAHDGGISIVKKKFLKY